MPTFDTTPQQELLEALMSRRELPARVFHYTTSLGFLGILESRSIRASDVRYLNDAQEYQYTLGLVRDLLGQRRQANSKDVFILERFEQTLNVAFNVRVYVSCFSALGDTLSQWRAYALGGFSLGFDPQLLLAAAVDYPEPVALLSCVYQQTEQENLVNEAIDFLIKTYQGDVSLGKDSSASLEAVEVHFFAHIVMLASCFKHPKFEEEREWRLIVHPRTPERGAVGRKIRSGSRWLIPYRDIPLAADSGTLELREVIVGPTPHASLAREGAMVALDERLVRYNSVVVSGIPYRDW
jgi:hypothetical protein